jgi:peroxiredoxin
MKNKHLDQIAAAPDFELTDTQGNLVRLSDFRGKQPVVLVLTRGFV